MSNFFYRNFKRSYPTISSAKGVWVNDTEGNSYLDGCSGAIVANLGHGILEINDAISRQLSQVAFAHTSQFVSQATLDLSKLIVDLAPQQLQTGARVYFTSGGSESVETALKMARAHFVERGDNNRDTVISRKSSYHGSTAGALSATGHPARRKLYLPLLRAQPQISAVYPYRCTCRTQGVCNKAECTLKAADELESAILAAGPDKVMAFIGEPVVGAAIGAAAPGDGYWERIRQICTKYGVLLIADEVMTGLGRLGSNFGLDLWGVVPDIICLGKGLSAGYLPLGAVLASPQVVESFENNSGIFEHGFTYSGHPVSCAAGVAAIDYLKQHGLVARVASRESEFFAALKQLFKFEIVGDVRGRGFMAGIELVADRQTKQPFAPEPRVSQLVRAEAAKVGLLVYPGSGSIDGINGDHIMVAPPFTITDQELEELFKRLEIALKAAMMSVMALR